jgi:glycosyltransferase involved in cell wall biosynthesis
MAAAGQERLSLIYHGLDFSRFPRSQPARPARDGSDAADPVILLSVGRAVPKKGIDVLIAALARLPAGLNWRLVHIGGGALLRKLAWRAARAGIAERVMWLGARPQKEVLANYRAADIFVLASRVTRDGDRDGLPNVLVEAQSQGLACVASNISAIPELIDDGITGRLVRPDDPAALAAALSELIAAPARRFALGSAGENRVRTRFSCDTGIARLMEKFAAIRPVGAIPAGSAGRSKPAGEPERAASCGLPSTRP